ncbi:MAG: hypothetical protein HY200_03175 [Nitrospirae bacterium]|nr:hypothetical protein [Nitrospirota bacterium]MBI3593934.1 hypothetical protein [Nitrospirota bacterium]
MKCEKCRDQSENGVFSPVLSFFICYGCVLNSGITGHPMLRICDDGNRNAKKDWGEESWEALLTRRE